MKSQSPTRGPIRATAKAFLTPVLARRLALGCGMTVALGYLIWSIQAPPHPSAKASAVSAAPVFVAERRLAPRHQVAPYATDQPVPAVEKLRARTEAELRDAIAAATAISDPAQRAETLVRLCYQWAELDPRGAVDLAFEHGLAESAGGVIGNLAQQWAAADLPAARAWVEAQAPGDVRDDLVARIGYLWAQSDPAAAADFVVSGTTPGPAQEEAAVCVLHQWARRDSAAARAWAECFPDGPLRERALREVVSLPAHEE